MASMQLEKPHEQASLKAADASSKLCEVDKASAVKEKATDQTMGAMTQTHAQQSKHESKHESVKTEHAKAGAADVKKMKKEEKKKKEKKDEKKNSSSTKPAKANDKIKEKKKKNKHKDDTSSSSSESDSDGHKNKKKLEGKKSK